MSAGDFKKSWLCKKCNKQFPYKRSVMKRREHAKTHGLKLEECYTMMESASMELTKLLYDIFQEELG